MTIQPIEGNPLVRYLGKDVVEIIKKDTPRDWIEERDIRGGGKASYVAGHHFIERLNEAFGFLWSSKVKDWKVVTTSQDNDKDKREQIVVLRELTIKVPSRKLTRILLDGTKEIMEFEGIEITKEQFGGSDVKKYAKDVVKFDKKSGEQIVTARKGDTIDLADDFKSGATDGLKKCGLDLGLFNDIYSKRGGEGGPSVQQLETLYYRGSEAGMDEEKTDVWVEEQTGKKTKDLDEPEVMGLIGKLIEKAKDVQDK